MSAQTGKTGTVKTSKASKETGAEKKKPKKSKEEKIAKKARKAAKKAAHAPAPVTITRAVDTTAFVRSLIRDVPDFPQPGILFKDITPLLANPRAFHILLDAIVAVEARGFIFGGALAARLNASFVPARKPGKLPAESDKVRYETEYSHAELEMHKGSLQEGSNVLIVDDVLATGGTALAAAELVRMQGAYVVGYAFALELNFLNGRDKLLPVRVESILEY